MKTIKELVPVVAYLENLEAMGCPPKVLWEKGREMVLLYCDLTGKGMSNWLDKEPLQSWHRRMYETIYPKGRSC